MSDQNAALCRIVSEEELRDPLGTVDSIGWLGGDIRGWRVLCLAAGGGRQSCLYAAAGARVTVVDLCPAMLERDREAARERKMDFEIMEGSMDDLSMLRGREFDLVIQPVSTCYVPDVSLVYQQVASVLKPGGIYISQHKTPQSLQASTEPIDGDYPIRHDYYRSDPVPSPARNDAVSRRLREPGAVEFLHRWEELIGGLCRAGFVVEDLIEPMHAKPDVQTDDFAARAKKIAPYVRIKARRTMTKHSSVSPVKPDSKTHKLWLPD